MWENICCLHCKCVVCSVCFSCHAFFFPFDFVQLLLLLLLFMVFPTRFFVYFLIMSRFFGCFSKNILTYTYSCTNTLLQSSIKAKTIITLSLSYLCMYIYKRTHIHRYLNTCMLIVMVLVYYRLHTIIFRIGGYTKYLHVLLRHFFKGIETTINFKSGQT